MNAVAIASPDWLLPVRRPPRGVVLAALVAQAAAVAAAAMTAWWVVLLPLLFALGALILVDPRIGLLALFPAMLTDYPLVPGTRIYAADVVILLMVVAHLCRCLAGHRNFFGGATPMDRAYAFFLAILALSLLGAAVLAPGIVNWVRHLEIVLLFYVGFSLLDRRLTTTLLIVLMIVSVPLLLDNILNFIARGGTRRIFGAAGPIIYSFSTLIVVQMAVAALLARTPLRRIGAWLLMTTAFVGIVASQSRSPVIQLALVIPVILVVVWRWGKRRGDLVVRRRVAAFVVILIALGILGVVVLGPYLEHTIDRYAKAFDGRETSAQIRFFLMRTSIDAFLSNPILGIGLVQVSYWHHVLPGLRFEAIAYHARGLGAHNDTLTYLAEGGILGLIGYLWFLWAAVRMGHRLFHYGPDMRDKLFHLTMYAMTALVVARGFLDTHIFWSRGGMLTSVVLAMAARALADAGLTRMRGRRRGLTSVSGGGGGNRQRG